MCVRVCVCVCVCVRARVHAHGRARRETISAEAAHVPTPRLYNISYKLNAEHSDCTCARESMRFCPSECRLSLFLTKGAVFFDV